MFHLIHTKCRHYGRECDEDLFKLIYRTCEGHRSCPVADLSPFLKGGLCDSAYQSNNVFVDYICVNGKFVIGGNVFVDYICVNGKFVIGGMVLFV